MSELLDSNQLLNVLSTGLSLWLNSESLSSPVGDGPEAVLLVCRTQASA